MQIIRYFFIVLILFLGVSFACLNAEMVNVDLYFTVYHLPLSLLLVLILGLGILVGFFAFEFKYLSLYSKNKQLQNQLKSVEQEVSNLRIIPLKND